MPITFGSVGDIIAVCLLVKDLVEALDEARGSRRDYQFVIAQLRILDRTLLEIDLLTKVLDNATTPQLRGICKAARDAATQCKTIIDEFLERVKKYKNSFDEGKSPGLIKDVVAKVAWRVGEREALGQFRANVVNANSNLQTLLATASVALMDINRKESEKRLIALDQQNMQSNTQQLQALEQIRQGINSTQQHVAMGNRLLNQISNTLQLDWLRQLGSELKGLICRAITMNIATYHAVVSIQTALPSRLERTLIDEPFILEDPIGRIAPIHLQFVTSWEAFNAVMEIRFSNLQGFRKMQERQYGLQEGATRREIEQTRSWQRAFLPGQKVEMAFVFQSVGVEDPAATNATCPGCQTPSTDASDAEIQCRNCSIRYRRITVVEEVEMSVMEEVEPWSIPCSNPEQPELRTKIQDSPQIDRKRKTSHDRQGEDDIRDFKRVRLMQIKKLVKQAPDMIDCIAGSDSNMEGLSEGNTALRKPYLQWRVDRVNFEPDGPLGEGESGSSNSLIQSQHSPRSTSEFSRRSWIDTTSLSEPETLNCPFDDCGATFRGEFRRGNLGRHVRRKHRGPLGDFLCEQPQCGRTFHRYDSRLKHYRKHHPWLAPKPVVPKPGALRRRQRNIEEEL